MFLTHEKSIIPTEIRDYSEWHQGRSYYSLWYIEIFQPELISYLSNLRELFSDFLLPSDRQFHITLFVCGFWKSLKQGSDNFSPHQLDQQIQNLQQITLKSIHLNVVKINSFETALILCVDDTMQSLNSIRNTLAEKNSEISPVDYCPHITLGLYRKAFHSKDILQYISKISPLNFKLKVNQITFGYYHSDLLQGPLIPYYQKDI